MAAPLILAFDTAAAHCAAALLSRGRLLAQREEPMTVGQAERLVPMLEEVLAQAGRTWHDLDALGVGTGPGNFTGIRISVAAARGLALGLGIPAVGVSMFEALLDPQGTPAEPALIISLEAPRGQAYVQHLGHGRPQGPPRLIDPNVPPADLVPPTITRVRGFRADAIARPFGAAWEEAAPTEVAAAIARIAERRLGEPGFDPSLRPAPLYVRGPDAAPPSDPPPVILPG